MNDQQQLPFLLNLEQVNYLLEIMKESSVQQPDLIELLMTGKRLMEEEL